MDQKPHDQTPSPKSNDIGSGLIIGVAFGLCLGVAIGSLPIGLAIGMVLGLVVGSLRKKTRQGPP